MRHRCVRGCTSTLGQVWAGASQRPRWSTHRGQRPPDPKAGRQTATMRPGIVVGCAVRDGRRSGCYAWSVGKSVGKSVGNAGEGAMAFLTSALYFNHRQSPKRHMMSDAVQGVAPPRGGGGGHGMTLVHQRRARGALTAHRGVGGRAVHYNQRHGPPVRGDARVLWLHQHTLRLVPWWLVCCTCFRQQCRKWRSPTLSTK